MKKKTLQFITTGLLLCIGFIPSFTKTSYTSTAHAGISAVSHHFAFGDMLHYMFHPVAVTDLVIAGTMAAALPVMLFLTWQMRRSFILLSAFVLLMLNILFVFSSLPAIFQWDTAYFVYERLPGFYIMAGLLLLYDVLMVFLFIKTEKQSEKTR